MSVPNVPYNPLGPEIAAEPPPEDPIQKYAPYIILLIILILIVAYAASRKKKRGRPKREHR